MTAATGPLRRAAAWAVHLLTASSAAAGILAVLAAERGAARTALAWMAYTVAVDSIDGTLARALEVKRVLPIVDGTRLDEDTGLAQPRRTEGVRRRRETAPEPQLPAVSQP